MVNDNDQMAADRQSRADAAQIFRMAELSRYQLTVPAGTEIDQDAALATVRRALEDAGRDKFQSVQISNPDMQHGQRYINVVDFVAEGGAAQKVADAFRDKATVRGGERGVVKPQPLSAAERGMPKQYLRSR